MAKYKARIKPLLLDHPVHKWAEDRSVPIGTLMPAPRPIADKPNGQKGKPIPHDDADLKELLRLNGGNKKVFEFIRRIGGWLYNTASNKHLIGRLRGLLWWMNNYVPFPLPKGKKAFAEKIYCDSNEVFVDKEQGKWAHLAAGIGMLTQYAVGTKQLHKSNVKWHVPPGWILKSALEKI